MRILSVSLCALLVVSVVLNLKLAQEVKSLNQTIELVKRDGLLKEGAAVPPISASAVDGSAALIRFDSVDVPTVIYVFTPGCGWCVRNLDAAKTLAEKLKGRYRVLGLSLSSDGIKRHVTEAGLSFPVYTDISLNTRTAYHLGGTPDTIVVSVQGKVIKHWQGAYVGLTKKEVESYFDVSLPPVSDH